MTYELEFVQAALTEWQKLDGSIREQFKKKLKERLQTPRVPAAKLTDHPDRYKIKLRAIGYRLVYQVEDNRLVVLVLAVGKRERNTVYKIAAKR